MSDNRQPPRAVIRQAEPDVPALPVVVAPPIQSPMDTHGHLAGVLATFALAVALFVIVLVMISASNA